jgi:sortase A
MMVSMGLLKVPQAKMRNRLRWVVSLALLTVGVVALSYCGIVLFEAKQHQADQSRRFDQALGEAQGAGSDTEVRGTSPAPSVISEGGPVRSGNLTQAAATDVPLGRIEVKSLGIMAMIEEGTAGATLQQAVGHILGTPLPGRPGNAGLAGHRDTFFRNLRNIHEADEITVTTLSGTYRYRVVLISIVEPSDTTVLAKSEESILTLVTCYPFSFVGFAPKRFIVRASLIESLPR